MNPKNTIPLPQTEWKTNVIIADAEYIDRVAFNLIVNFERMIGRQIPPADMAKWVDCIALDGGLRPRENSDEPQSETMVILLHDKTTTALENFSPAKLAEELDGKAFNDQLGEFVFSVVSHEGLTTKAEFTADITSIVGQQKEVKRMMIVPNADDEETISLLRQTLRDVSDEKRVTLFAMEPLPGGNFRQEILGYSLMAALGIRGDEL